MQYIYMYTYIIGSFNRIHHVNRRFWLGSRGLQWLLFSVKEEVPTTKPSNEEPVDNIGQLIFSAGVSYGHVFFSHLSTKLAALKTWITHSCAKTDAEFSMKRGQTANFRIDVIRATFGAHIEKILILRCTHRVDLSKILFFSNVRQTWSE